MTPNQVVPPRTGSQMKKFSDFSRFFAVAVFAILQIGTCNSAEFSYGPRGHGLNNNQRGDQAWRFYEDAEIPVSRGTGPHGRL